MSRARLHLWIIAGANLIGLFVLLSLGLHYARKQQTERDSERPWLSYLNSPFPTLETVVTAGEPVTLVVQRRSTAPDRRLYRVGANLVSDSDPIQRPIILNTPSSIVDPGDTEWVSSVNVVPSNTQAGTYHIEGLAEVQGNYHTFSVPWSSQSFKVMRPPFAR